MIHGFEVIDSHCHPFLEVANNICMYWPELASDDFCGELKSCGISLCIGSLIGKPQNAQETFELNRQCLEFASRHGDFFMPGLLAHRDDPEGSCAQIQQAYDRGILHWIGEWVPYAVGIETLDDYCDRGFFPVFDLAQHLELPIDLHGPTPLAIETILDNFPKLNIVIAHPNERATYLETLELMKKHPTLHQGLSGTGLFRWGMLRYGVRAVGAERFLLGTDYPVCNPAMPIAGVLSEHITDDEKALILAGNVRRLAKIG